MIAPFYIPNDLGGHWILWGNVRQCAGRYPEFWMLGEHSYYCPIKWEVL